MSSGRPALGAREPAAPWAESRIVLGVCGGVAAYKAVQLARDLTLLGGTVDVVLTDAARNFIAPLSFEGVTGRGALVDLFAVGGAALHVTLGREADCVCVAPATADFIARAASGRASDLLTTAVVASGAPVVIAPAMNDGMFAYPRTRTNLAALEARPGYHRVGPATGLLAAGEGSGPGRMADTGEIVDAVGRALGSRGALAGAKVLVTGGPTREPLDAVRYLGNRSSGKTGFELARAAWLRGADVTPVTGPASIPGPCGVELIAVETACQMRDAVQAVVDDADAAIFAAAVADYRPGGVIRGKVRRSEIGSRWEVAFTANPDIAAEAVARMKAGSVSVGFALEISDLVARAEEKLVAKGFDLIVGNLAGEASAGFEADTNRVTILGRGMQARELPRMSKFAMACEILDLIEARLAAVKTGGGP